MPLSKLFHKRNSLKDEKTSLDSNSEVFHETESKDSIPGIFTNIQWDANTQLNEQHQEENEHKTALEEKINEDANEGDVSLISKSEDKMKANVWKTIVSKKTKVEEPLKTRSLSCKESGMKPNVPRSRRRKCESESFNSTDDEGFEDKVIQLKEKDLERVIGHFVDKLIRESIATAVKSVNVDSVYDEVMKSVSRSQSESSDSIGCPETVQQKIHTDSITDYVDLRMIHTFEESRPEDEMLEVADGDSQNSELTECFEYSPNYPGNALLQTDDELEEGEETANEKKAALHNADNCANKEARLLEVEEFTHSRTERSNKEWLQDSDARQQQDKNRTVMKISENMEKSYLGDDAVLSSQSEDNSLLTTGLVEIFQETVLQKEVEISGTIKDMEQIEMIEENATTIDTDIENIAQDKLTDDKNHVGDQQEETEEEFKKMDGYHADCEESVSIHSLVLESSCVKEEQNCPPTIFVEELCGKVSKMPKSLVVEADLMTLSGDKFSQLLTPSQSALDQSSDLSEQTQATEEEKKVNWKVGYLHVKLPHKTRGKGHLKVWKKRCVAIQPDEFANDPTNPCLVLSVYSGESGAARKHSASFWKSVSCHNALVYRSSSRTHKYAFTLSDDQGAVVHLSAESEALAQEWMVAIRAILWPPSPVMQLEKMLNGCQFEISIIDNDFSYRAGLLGAYGHLTITPRKLILVHPQQGYVVQEWYLNTVDKFQLVPQTRIEDVNKVLAMTTCSDSSTGRGDILIFCREAVGLLQAVASTIHSILMQHSKEEGGTYQKELEEIGHWLDLPQPQEDYYKVPPRQVKSLLDIPNFIFDKPVIPVSIQTGNQDASMETFNTPSAPSETDDFLNCSITSFVVGGGNLPGKSSDSELSDAYSPPRSPEIKTKKGP